MVRVSEEYRRIRRRFQERAEESQIWDAVQLARHQNRPYTLDYVEHLMAATSSSSTATARSATTPRS